MDLEYIDENVLFMPTEKSIIKSLSKDNFLTNSEFFSIHQILNLEKINLNYIEKAFILLVNRQENLRLYYEYNNEKNIIQRKYINKVKNIKLNVYILNLDSNDIKFKQFLNERKKEKLNIKQPPFENIKLIKTKDSYFIMIYGHHAVYDVVSSNIIVEELLHIYNNIKDKTFQYENNAYKGLNPVIPYIEIVNKFHEIQNKEYNDSYNYIKEVYLDLNLKNKYLKYIDNFESTHRNFITTIDSKQFKYIISNKIKIHQLFKTLFQIAICIVLDINPVPIYNINGKRPINATNKVCSYLKQQPFISYVDKKNTIKNQYDSNIKFIKNFMQKFDNIDFDKIQMDIFNNEKKDYRPKIMFNFFNLDFSKGYIARSDLYNDYNEIWGSESDPINIYYEVCINQLDKNVYHEFVFKNKVFEEKIQKNIVDLIYKIFNNIDTFFNIKIRDIEFLYNNKSKI